MIVEKVNGMCKAWSDAQAEAARNAAILATIETARQYKVSDDVILADIMKKYNLTEQEAKDYMLKKSA